MAAALLTHWTGNPLMTFEIFRGVFCVMVGISWGVIYFGVKLLTGSTGGIGAVGDRNKEGGVKFFSLWNLGLVSTLTVAGFLWLSLREDSIVARIIADSWDYLVANNLVG